MTRWLQYIVVALAIGAPASAAKPKPAAQWSRPCDPDAAQLEESLLELRRKLIGPLKTLADQMAQAHNREDLAEIIWELTTDYEVAGAALNLGAAIAALLGSSSFSDVLEQQMAEDDEPETDLALALRRLVNKSVKLMNQGPGIEPLPDDFHASDELIGEFMAAGRSPFAPKGDRWFTTGVLRFVVCAMGHLALGAKVLPGWIDAATLDELMLEAVLQAEAGLDILLDPARPDLRVADAARRLFENTQGEPGSSQLLFGDRKG